QKAQSASAAAGDSAGGELQVLSHGFKCTSAVYLQRRPNAHSVCATSRLEAAKDDYRIHCEELEKQLIELQHRNDELTSLAEESRALKDELDVLRICSDRVVMLEASVETYKRKLENLGDLKRQVKLLEENNMTYMQNSVSLEEELRKANAARAQLESYKRQVKS
ncbi:Protein Hook 1, partial [Xenoophorus captivus]